MEDHGGSLGWLRFSSDTEDRNGLFQVLLVIFKRLDLFDEMHAGSDAAESGKTLSIRVAFSSEVEFRLIFDADKELCVRGAGGFAGHGEGSIAVAEAACTGAFMGDVSCIEIASFAIHTSLDHFNLNGIAGLIVRSNHAVELGFARAIDFVVDVL